MPSRHVAYILCIVFSLFVFLTACRVPPQPASPLLLVSQSTDRHVAWVDPAQGVVAQVEVGGAPHGLAVAADGRAYVATAEGVAVVDNRRRQRLALVPYQAQAQIGAVQFGEYRPGGMGIAVAPDGRRVYVGVYLAGQPSQMEVLDTQQLVMVASVPVGLRPFDMLVSRDGREVYSIDHDGYSVTVVDTATLTPRTLTVAPIGRGAFDKPHYAALGSDGRLLMPIQGRALAMLDPTTGALTTTPLTANSHQHGVALTPDGRLLIVGTGPAGGATAGPSLTLLNMATQTADVIPLTRPHERVAVSPDGRYAYLSGGFLLSGGWDGLTRVDLAHYTTVELAVPHQPLGLAFLP